MSQNNKSLNATNNLPLDLEEDTALKQFQFRIHKQVLAILNNYITDAEAQEVFQEAIYKVFLLAKQNPSSQPLLSKLLSLQPMLFTIARNLAISKLRHKQVREKYLAEQSSKNNSIISESLETILSKEGDIILLKNAISKLPPICQKIFIDRKIHEKSYTEIAEKYNISKKTVENHISKGVKLCREYILKHIRVQNNSSDRPVDIGNKRA